jgi:hypothetical protein
LLLVGLGPSSSLGITVVILLKMAEAGADADLDEEEEDDEDDEHGEDVDDNENDDNPESALFNALGAGTLRLCSPDLFEPEDVSRITSYIAVFTKSKVISTLYVEHCEITSDIVQSLAEYLQACPDVNKVIIMDCAIEDAGFSDLMECLGKIHRLEDLCFIDCEVVNDNNLPPCEWKSLLLLKNLKKIEWYNMILQDVDHIKLLPSVLVHLRCLREIVLANNNLTDAGVREILLALPPGIERITLNDNQVTDVAFKDVCLVNVTKLVLRDVDFTSVGFRNFCFALRSMTKLTDLEVVVDDTLTEDDFACLVDVLRHLNLLERLAVHNEGTSVIAWRALSSAFEFVPALQVLSVFDDNIDDVAMETFAVAIKGIKRLRFLHLESVGIRDHALKVLMDSMTHVNSLRRLIVRNRDFPFSDQVVHLAVKLHLNCNELEFVEFMNTYGGREFYSSLESSLLELKKSLSVRTMVLLSTPASIPRIGRHSFVKLLPIDIIRQLKSFLFDDSLERSVANIVNEHIAGDSNQ